MCFKQLLILTIGLWQIRAFAQINDKILSRSDGITLFGTNILAVPIINFYISAMSYRKSNIKIVLC